MGTTLTRDEACRLLGVDIWALQRLVEMGEIAVTADGGYDAKALESVAEARAQRRAEALADIAALDAPHLGLIG